MSTEMDGTARLKGMEHVHQKDVSWLDHVVFIDYDDTLLCSTYLLSNLNIDFELRHNTKSNPIGNYKVKGTFNDLEMAQFTYNLDKSGQAALTFLTKICSKFKATNIKIVTNSGRGWVRVSLSIASHFCKTYEKIEQLLYQSKIEIIYARDHYRNKDDWKTTCFDRLLRQHFNVSESEKALRNKLNIITIGDQWTDHHSVEQTFCFHVMSDWISHHQIKLFPNPDCRYLGIELKYITGLLDEDLLFTFNSQHENGLVLEFDGYDS
eukprot:202639_1